MRAGQRDQRPAGECGRDERTRGAADDGVSVFGLFQIPKQLQVESVRNIDRAMFFGNDRLDFIAEERARLQAAA